MFRALKTIHIRSSNKRLRLRKIPITNRSTPYRPAIIRIIRLENILFVLVVCVDGTADITDGDGECSFPAGTLGARVTPLALQRGLDAVVGCDVVVVVSSYIVGVQRGVYDVLEEALARCNGLLERGDFRTSTVTPA